MTKAHQPAVPFQIEDIVDAFQREGRPLLINTLARGLADAHFARRFYAPGARYEAGETIVYEQRLAHVDHVRAGGNPAQGQFDIVTLSFVDGAKVVVACNVSSGPTTDRHKLPSLAADKALLGESGVTFRRVLREMLRNDAKFDSCQFDDGDYWCPIRMLPSMADVDVDTIAATLTNRVSPESITPCTTNELMQMLWGMADDGSNEYVLYKFALTRFLEEFADIQRYGDGWLLVNEWKSFANRPTIIVPRKPTELPVVPGLPSMPGGVELPIAGRGRENDDAESGSTFEDLHEWERQRRNTGWVILSPMTYYRGAIPLTAQLRRVFPPYECGTYPVTLHHFFGSEKQSLHASVDLSQRLILGHEDLYQTWVDHAIYPGAKVIITRQENTSNYTMKLSPVHPPIRLLVRRIALDGNGQVVYSEAEEPVAYEVDGEIFVAATRFDDPDALVAQADESGASIFQLMYERCLDLWQADRQKNVIVDVNRLYALVTTGPKARMTGQATIAWQLWRRLAFEAIGGGKYRFRPEYRDAVRGSNGSARMGRTASPVSRPRPKTRTLPRVIAKVPPKESEMLEVKVPNKSAIVADGNDILAQILAVPERKSILEEAVQQYKTNPHRKSVYVLRQYAHSRIRKRLTPDNLSQLSLDDFNRHIWQIGHVSYEGHKFLIDSEEARQIFNQFTPQQLQSAIMTKQVQFVGNQTWGSATAIVGANLKLTDKEKLSMVRSALVNLLYADGNIGERIQRILNEPNGFGINCATGILMAMFPDEHVLYNSRSVEFLRMLGVEWSQQWQTNVPSYFLYRNLSKALLAKYKFHGYLDWDFFVYECTKGVFHSATNSSLGSQDNILPEVSKSIAQANEQIAIEFETGRSTEDLLGKYVYSLNPNVYHGWVVVHQRKLKTYYDVWARYLQFMDNNPEQSESVIMSATGIHWRGTMHPRYLGLITEDRIVTSVGRKFYMLTTESKRDELLNVQVQKWYYCVDQFYRPPDPKYQLYPLFALLQVLLSLPESKHAVSMDELRFFILPMQRFKEWSDRVKLIRAYRTFPESAQAQVAKYFKHSYIDRLSHLLELCPYLHMTESTVRLRADKVTTVAEHLTCYGELESKGRIPHYRIRPSQYLEMLRSDKSIFEFCS